MPNVHCIISGHNKTIRDKTLQTDTPADRKITKCNCRDQNSCPLSNKCLTSSVVYQATVTRSDTNKKQTYVGHTEGEFKTRLIPTPPLSETQSINMRQSSANMFGI